MIMIMRSTIMPINALFFIVIILMMLVVQLVNAINYIYKAELIMANRPNSLTKLGTTTTATTSSVQLFMMVTMMVALRSRMLKILAKKS